MNQAKSLLARAGIEPAFRPQLIFDHPQCRFPDKLNITEEVLDRRIHEGHGDKVAVLYEDRKITYRELYESVNRLGNGLLSLGVQSGDLVILRIPNRPEFIVSALAIHKIGAVPVPTMMLLRETTLTRIANKSRARLMIVDAELMEEVERGRANHETIENVIVIGKGQYHSYAELLEKSSPKLDPVAMDRDELGAIFFTGGTTGEPKGCMHHVTAPMAIIHVSECIYPGGIRDIDVFGGTPPLPFVYGYFHAMLIPLRFGATVSLIAGRATPEKALEAVERHGVTLFHSVPSMYRMILNIPEAEKKFRCGTLRACVTASAPIPPPTIREWKERFGLEIINIIGSHELLGSFIGNWRPPYKPGSLGYVYPGYECAILNDHGNERPQGEAGKLALRGPTGVMYLDQPQEQRKAVLNGWSLTGDAAYKDPDGCIWHVSRTDDIIKSRGYRISPEEVENSLNEHPAVLECGVIGVADEIQGERVKAFVVLRPGYQASDRLAEELKQFSRARIAPYAAPSTIAFIEALPRTDLLKLSRVALRKMSSKAIIRIDEGLGENPS